MGIGSAHAIRRGLARAGRRLDDIDLFDINEAFAASNLAVEQELGLDSDRANVDGGAISLGHAFAASGVRITMHLAYELRRRKLQRAIGAACVGGGQGIAVMLEA
jgi:acetyl-CoA C-acetyltransferase/acetyl-CoA acyltransferase 2